MTTFDLDLSKYQLGWNDEVEYAFDPVKGLHQGVVEQISWWKGEPRWMTEFRLRSLRLFDRKPMAEWFATNMPDIDFQDIYYYLKPAEGLGGLLIHQSLEIAASLGWERVILVGDAPYYSRFGFVKLDHVEMPPPTNPDRVLGYPLLPNAWDGVSGRVRRFI